LFDLGGDVAAAPANDAQLLNLIMIGVFRAVSKMERKK